MSSPDPEFCVRPHGLTWDFPELPQYQVPPLLVYFPYCPPEKMMARLYRMSHWKMWQPHASASSGLLPLKSLEAATGWKHVATSHISKGETCECMNPPHLDHLSPQKLLQSLINTEIFISKVSGHLICFCESTVFYWRNNNILLWGTRQKKTKKHKTPQWLNTVFILSNEFHVNSVSPFTFGKETE